MKRNRLHSAVALLASIVTIICGGSANAVIVTDNNLIVTNLGNLSASGATTSINFQSDEFRLLGLKSTINSTNNGSPSNGYWVDSISNVANQTYPTALQAGIRNLVAPGVGGVLNADGSYGPATHNFVYGVRNTPNLYYNLRVGSQFGFLNWAFQANNVTTYKPAGADYGLMTTGPVDFQGNLVPNASFEDTSLGFFNGGGFVSDPGKHGSTVWQVASPNTLDRSIALPVRNGVLYAFSFWYFRSAGSDTEVEYGLTVPFTRGAEPGNTLPGGPLGQWLEATGTFRPNASQPNFYIAAFANVGFVRFDSFYLAEIPEPSYLAFLASAGLCLGRFRKRH